MPRRKQSGLSDKELTIIIVGIASLIAFAIIYKFIIENPWTRIVVFILFGGILFISLQRLINDLKYHTVNKNTLWAFGGAFISILMVIEQIRFLFTSII